MAIVINGSGTVTGLAVGGLPDGTVDAGTLATNSVTAAKLEASAITASDLPAGSVLQVVNFRSTANNTSTTSQSYVDTGMSATITPSSTSSKILVVANLNGLYKDNAQNAISTKLLRGSTDIGTIDSMNTYTDNTDTGASGASISYLDSPNTSSAVTYKIQFASISSSNVMINIRWNASYTTHSTITLMEIAG